MKAKIKDFRPIVNDNGDHMTFSTDKGTFYKFSIEFDDGTRGIANSKKDTPSWKIGVDYTFDKEEKNGFVNIRKLTEFKEEGSGYTSSNKGGYNKGNNYGTQEEQLARQKAIILQSSMDRAVHLCNHGKIEIDDIYPVGEQIAGWVMAESGLVKRSEIKPEAWASIIEYAGSRDKVKVVEVLKAIPKYNFTPDQYKEIATALCGL